MKKTIETKKLQTWRMIDRLAWLIPVVIGGVLVITGAFGNFGEVMEQDPSVQTALVYIALGAVVVLLLSLPLILLWRAVSRQIKKGYLQRATIPLAQDLDYYRDKLTGLSPTVISMLADLQIEPQKDAAALILKYQLMGVVAMVDDSIVVRNPSHPDLKPSDRALLEQLATVGPNSPGVMSANSPWLALAKREAAESPCFQRAGGQKGCLITGCLLPFLFFIGVMALIWFSVNSSWYQEFGSTLQTLKDDFALIHQARTDPVFLRGLLLFLTLSVLMLAALFQPVISIVRALAKGYNLFQGGIKRTAYGEEMAEYVYGMKNFLRDFSNLSEADQEHLILWDDFLVYAVILEENEQIVRQIMNKRSLYKPV